jgi:NAD(P)-dependent dehydrogenase (short-subunit alcohol dehydrogenase family)
MSPETSSAPEVVVITGASAGVGRATARVFARHGASVALLARGQQGLDGARRDVENAGGRALAVPTDVADAEQVEAAAARAESELGPIDIWINNAMTSVFSPIAGMRPEEYRRVTEVTYLGSVYGTLAALRRMRARNRGKIVQVGSALAFRGIPLQSAYCAAKHAVQGFLESLRCELLHEGSAVDVTEVHLPAMNTPQFDWVKSRLPRRAQPVPPIYQPEVGAEAVFWAAHHTRRELWVGLPTVGAILGNRVAPGMLDRYLAATGYDGQQSDEPEDPARPDNLWAPVPGDRGARGRFDADSLDGSLQLWAATHRRALTAAALLAGAAFVVTALASNGTEPNAGRVHRRAPGPGPRERDELRALIARGR